MYIACAIGSEYHDWRGSRTKCAQFGNGDLKIGKNLEEICLYHWVEHPNFEREVAIVRLRVPQIAESLARQVAAAVEAMRGLNLYKPPGVAETIDWATALGQLGILELDETSVAATLGTVLKYREDHERVRETGIADLVKQAFDRGLSHN